MAEFIDRASAWRMRMIDSAVMPYVPESVAMALPGFFAAMSCGGIGASVAHLLPMLRRSQPHDGA